MDKKMTRAARRRKQRNRRILLTVALMMAVVLVSVGGTIAWITANTGTITNTFTVGNINIALAESEDLNLKMIPGNVIDKDPIVTVTANSEDCYLFVKIEKTGGNVTVDGTTYDFDDFLTYMVTEGWTPLVDGASRANGSGIFYRVVDNSTTDQSFHIIGLDGNDDDTVVAESEDSEEYDKVSVNVTVTKKMLNAIDANNAPVLKFTAYACQKANVATAEAAWENIGAN